MGRRRKRRGHNDCTGAIVAFGAGLLIAMFFSVKLALVVAAIALIYVGLRYKSC